MDIKPLIEYLEKKISEENERRKANGLVTMTRKSQVKHFLESSKVITKRNISVINFILSKYD
jgi:hypothetical protein